MHLVMIGGSDAGISAALRARDLDPSADVTVVVADAYPNFSICGIPYYVSGEVTHWRNLAHRTVGDLEATGMALRLDTTARRIDVAGRDAYPIRCRPRRWRSSPVPDSSQITTVEAPISMRESRPKPARATDRAPIAATASTTMPTTFHARVRYFRMKPRRARTCRYASSMVATAVSLQATSGTCIALSFC